MNHVFITASSKNPILEDYSDTIKEFIKDMVPLLHKPDDVIVLEGDKPRYFYIIAIGNCTVHHERHMC